MSTKTKKFICLLAALALLCTASALPVAAEPTATNVSGSGVQGDANGDGLFNMKDVLSARKYIADLLDNLDVTAADINADGNVNMKDILLMRYLLAGYEVQNGTVSTTKKPTTTTKATTATTSANGFTAVQEEILSLVNIERAKAGLSALELDQKSCAAAVIRAKEVAQMTTLKHERLDGSSCFTALDEVGASYIAAGENIAKGFRTAAAVMEGWMNSEGHRANILTANFTHLGVGYDAATNSWAQMFITKTGATLPADEKTTLEMTNALLKNINSVRTSKGLKAFTTTAALRNAATTLAKEQGQMGELSFTRPNGEKYTTVLADANITYTKINNHIAFCIGCKTLDNALSVWAENGDYSEWLDASYTRIGIGYDETTGYWSILTLN